MQIALFVHGWDDRLGGGARHFRELAERLASDGHDVVAHTTNASTTDYLWDPSGGHTPADATELNGVTVRRYPIRHLPGNHWRLARLISLLWPPQARYMEPPAPWVPEMQAAAQRVPENGAEIVHGRCFPYDSVLTAAQTLARKSDCGFCVTPLLHWGRGEVDSAEFGRFYARAHQREMLREATVVFTLTPSEAEVAASLGAREDALVVTGMGIDPRRAASGDAAAFRERHNLHSPIVLHMCSRAEAKGTAAVVEAAEVLWERGEEFSLVMAGPTSSWFDAWMAERAPVSHRILDLGYVAESEKRDLLASADLFVMPSRADAFGVVYLEAWANSVPVIGARAGGVPDVIEHSRDGLLVEFGDVNATAEAMAQLLRNPDLRARMGEAGREKLLAKFTSDAVYARITETYDRVKGLRYGEVPR